MQWQWRKLPQGTGHDDLVRETNKALLQLTHELKALRAFQHGTGDAGIATVARINPTSGAGLGINAAALDFATLALGGSFTSGGASDHAEAFTIRTALVGASGDTVALNLAAVGLGGGSVTTQGAAETIAIVSSLYLAEPNITVGTGDTVTNAATAYIAGAPTEGTNNYALWVDDGAVRIDQGVALGGGSAATLGTIGGSGPASAGQAQWLEIDIGGTPHWIPAWT